MQIKGKKVLLMGLGILGGGVATAEWLLEQGAALTITDMKDAEALKVSLEKLDKHKKNIKFVLGEHREEDFLNNEIIVVNPDVPIDNKFVKFAKENGKVIENELSLFYKLCNTINTVGITGTRGKTTTVNWTAHLLEAPIVGNSPDNPFLGDRVSQNLERLVLEIPSFQLELVGEYTDSLDYKLSPHVAVITNLYRDHINRHKTMEGYALAKANIFKYQDENDYLILNKDNEWTDFFLQQKPKSKVILFSKEDNFDFLDKDNFVAKWGEHNLANLVVAIRVAKIFGIADDKIKERIETLPQIKFRQEKVFDNGEIEIYNDTSATSPEATIAAVERFKVSENLILISGGTDKELEFDGFAKEIRNMIKPENMILLSGSATEKMKKELNLDSYNEFDTLEDCVKKALDLAKSLIGKKVILFSPASKSFEKFKNEFDRGEKFNVIVKELI